MLPLRTVKLEPGTVQEVRVLPISLPTTKIKQEIKVETVSSLIVEVPSVKVEIKVENPPAEVRKRSTSLVKNLSPVKVNTKRAVSPCSPEVIVAKKRKRRQKQRTEVILPKRKLPSPLRRKIINSNPLDNWRENSLFKIGIFDKNYMTQENLTKLKRALIISIMVGAEGAGPKFYECIEQPGWLQISCKSRKSFTWISEVIQGLKPWPNAELSIRNCNQHVNIWVVTLMVSYDCVNTPHEVVTLLKKQNIGLNADCWLMTNVLYGDNCFKVEFKLTEDQVDELRRIDYKPSLGFGKPVVGLRVEI